MGLNLNWLKWAVSRWHFYLVTFIWAGYIHLDSIKTYGLTNSFLGWIGSLLGTTLFSLIIYFLAYYFKQGWKVEHSKG